jgi:hypothetical protein
MNRVGELRINGSLPGSIHCDLRPDCVAALVDNEIDAVIHATEDGFSPLGSTREYLARELGIDEGEINRHANWNRFENERVAFVAISSRRIESRLRGVILAASETSRSHARFLDDGGSPEDFHALIARAALQHAHCAWGARNIAITHLTASGNFREHTAKMTSEAYIDVLATFPVREPSALHFAGCCIQERHMEGTKQAIAFAPYVHAPKLPATRVEVVDRHIVIGYPDPGRSLAPGKLQPRPDFANAWPALLRSAEACTALGETAQSLFERYPDAERGLGPAVEALEALHLAMLAADRAEQALCALDRSAR